MPDTIASLHHLVEFSSLTAAINLIYVGMSTFRFRERAIKKCEGFRQSLEGAEAKKNSAEQKLKIKVAKTAHFFLQQKGWPSKEMGPLLSVLNLIIHARLCDKSPRLSPRNKAQVCCIAA